MITTMTTKILFIDDEQNILDAYRRSLRKQFDIDTALGGAEALRKMKEDGPYAILITDMRMPGMDGLEFLRQAQTAAPNSVRMMLTGNADQRTAAEAVNRGHVFRFLSKPCQPEDFALALQAGLHQYRLITAEKELLTKTLGATIRVLVELLGLVNHDLFDDAQVLRQHMKSLTEALQATGGLEPKQEAWALDLAALLARIGTVAVPPALVCKARQGDKLTDEEQRTWFRVPEVGYNLLRKIPRLEEVANIIRYQQKNFDGTGVPDEQIAGSAIPQGARMLKVLIDLAEIEAGKVARNEALAMLQRRQGHYDPAILAAFAPAVADASASKPAYKTVSVPLTELTCDDILAGDIETLDGHVLLAADRRLSEVLLERLNNYAATAGIKEPILVKVFPAPA